MKEKGRPFHSLSWSRGSSEFFERAVCFSASQFQTRASNSRELSSTNNLFLVCDCSVCPGQPRSPKAPSTSSFLSASGTSGIYYPALSTSGARSGALLPTLGATREKSHLESSTVGFFLCDRFWISRLLFPLLPSPSPPRGCLRELHSFSFSLVKSYQPRSRLPHSHKRHQQIRTLPPTSLSSRPDINHGAGAGRDIQPALASLIKRRCRLLQP